MIIFFKLNKLQLIKRKRILTEDELFDLEKMTEDVNDNRLICGIHIISYPIYNLL